MTFRAKLDHAVRHFDQHTISGRMAPCVVNELKVIAIKKQQSGVGLRRSVFHQRRNAVAEGGTICETGQRVMHRGSHQLRISRL
ncbi:hypothetical protein D3C80_1085980 [compost metagenome]